MSVAMLQGVLVALMLSQMSWEFIGAQESCPPGSYGKDCICSSPIDDTTCIASFSSSNIVCSGRGDCVCGICECHARRAYSAEKYSGEFCQCDDYSCSYSNNMICGGHGRCMCGECMCDEGYSGDACNCPMSKVTCMTANGVICNGVGVCECGVCRCDQNTSYKGPTCEECPTCPGQCTIQKNCAFCKAFGTGQYTREECDNKCDHVMIVDKLDDVRVSDGTYLCQFTDDEDDCRVFFTYMYSEHNLVIVDVQTTKVCGAYQGVRGNEGNSNNSTATFVSPSLVTLVTIPLLRNLFVP